MRRGKNFGVDDDEYDAQRIRDDLIGPAITAGIKIGEEKAKFETLEKQLCSLSEQPPLLQDITLERTERALHPDEKERRRVDLYRQAHRLAKVIVHFRHSFPSYFKPVESELNTLEERCRQYIPDSVRHYERATRKIV